MNSYKFIYEHKDNDTQICFIEFVLSRNNLLSALKDSVAYAKHHIETNFMFIDFDIDKLFIFVEVDRERIPVKPLMSLLCENMFLLKFKNNAISAIFELINHENSNIYLDEYKTDYNNKKTTIGIEFEIDNDLITSKIHERIVENLKGGK